MTLLEAFELFLLSQQLRGNSEKTIHGYKGFLGRFLAYLKNAGIETAASLTLAHVNRYQLYIASKPSERGANERLTKKSVQTYMRHIKVFLAFCYEENFISVPIHLKIKLPKAERPLIKILTGAEISAVFECFDLNTEIGLRNRAIFSLLLDCGLRRAELTRIKSVHINFDKNYMHVIGKGNKERLVPLGAKVRLALRGYQRARPAAAEAKHNQYFFLTNRRGPLTVHCIASLMGRLKAQTGIPRLHAHLFRHTYATNFLVHGLGDVYELSRLLGHAELKTTEQYLQIASYYTIMLNRQSYSFLDTQQS